MPCIILKIQMCSYITILKARKKKKILQALLNTEFAQIDSMEITQ